MPLCSSFLPAVRSDSEVLILGSMPGIRSLTEQQYYAHPQNRFWPTIATLLNKGTVPEAYEDKLALLLNHRIALWDVLKFCHREGSLDSAITAESANDFHAFLSRHSRIHRICFNGGKACAAYKKHIGWIFSDRISYIQLPSTSPANAKWRLPMLVELYRTILPEAIKIHHARR